MRVVKLNGNFTTEPVEVLFILLLESPHYVFDSCSTEEVLLFDNQLLGLSFPFVFLLIQYTRNSLSPLTGSHKLNIVVFRLNVEVPVVFNFKRRHGPPESKVISIESVVAWNWSVVSHSPHVFTTNPLTLLNHHPVLLHPLPLHLSVQLNSINHIVPLDLPGVPLRQDEVRQTDLFPHFLY